MEYKGRGQLDMSEQVWNGLLVAFFFDGEGDQGGTTTSVRRVLRKSARALTCETRGCGGRRGKAMCIMST